MRHFSSHWRLFALGGGVIGYLWLLWLKGFDWLRFATLVLLSVGLVQEVWSVFRRRQGQFDEEKAQSKS
jgi:cbb3-type cytochrome oxidase subunit 3